MSKVFHWFTCLICIIGWSTPNFSTTIQSTLTCVTTIKSTLASSSQISLTRNKSTLKSSTKTQSTMACNNSRVSDNFLIGYYISRCHHKYIDPIPHEFKSILAVFCCSVNSSGQGCTRTQFSSRHDLYMEHMGFEPRLCPVLPTNQISSFKMLVPLPLFLHIWLFLFRAPRAFSTS